MYLMQIGFNMDNDNNLDELSWSNCVDENVEIINNEMVTEEISVPDNKKNGEIINNSPDSITKYICVEDIMKENLLVLTSNEILQYECSIAYFIQALFEGDTTNKLKSIKKYDNDLTFEKIQSIIEYLRWISNASAILAKKIGREIIPLKNTEPPSIIRSSYNFCSRYTQCKNFYSKQQEPICTEHHYVHSLLKNDVESVMAHLNYICQNKIVLTKENLENIHMSIKTICFVTRHMAKEISYIDYITKNNSEIFHRNNPMDANKKKSSNRIIIDDFKFQKASQFNSKNSGTTTNRLCHAEFMDPNTEPHQKWHDHITNNRYQQFDLDNFDINETKLDELSNPFIGSNPIQMSSNSVETNTNSVQTDWYNTITTLRRNTNSPTMDKRATNEKRIIGESRGINEHHSNHNQKISNEFCTKQKNKRGFNTTKKFNHTDIKKYINYNTNMFSVLKLEN